MAALAVKRNGHEPVIYAKGPSPVNEDMFLMAPLPGVSGRHDATLHIIGKGTAAGYARKVYGSADAESSFDKQHWGYHRIWWLKPLYEQLLDRFEQNIEEVWVGMAELVEIAKHHALVLSTIPAPQLCYQSHYFEEREVYLTRRPDFNLHPGVASMLYNGSTEDPWYRFSWLNCWCTLEFATRPMGEHQVARKVIGNNCDCHPGVHRVGRWAQWQRGILNHYAFEQATAALATEGMGKEAAA